MLIRFNLSLALVFPLIFIGYSSSFAQRTIAIMDFVAKGVSEMEASALTDRLRTEMVQTGKYKVVEREMMNVILAEQGFQMSGCVTDKCIVAVGQVLGAAQMVAGSISKVGETYSVSARIVDVETGAITQIATLDHSGAIDELLRSGMSYISAVLSGEKEKASEIYRRAFFDKRVEKKRYQESKKYHAQRPALAIGTGVIGNSKYGVPMVMFEYSQGILPSTFFSLEGALQRFDTWEEARGGTDTLYYIGIGTPEKSSFMAMANLNQWIVRDGAFRFYAFAGWGLLRVTLKHIFETNPPLVGAADKTVKTKFSLFSGGIGVNLVRRPQFTFDVETGYTYSKTKVLAIDKEWGVYELMRNFPNPSISTGGILVKLKFRMIL